MNRAHSISPQSSAGPGRSATWGKYRRLQEDFDGRIPVPPLPSLRKRFQAVLLAFFRPVSRERREMNDRRRKLLPEHLRGPSQTMGRSHHSCGATYGLLERCNFACTSCYLGKGANATAALSSEEVRHQLDTLRRFLGPQGKAQITAGEVTLLPVAVLGSYVRYAIAIGLDLSPTAPIRPPMFAIIRPPHFGR